MAEKITCPRRLREFGPWEKAPNLDEWEDDRWKERDFPKTVREPRTCSFCGGVNPDDAIRLIKSGFEVAGTGKSYKRYIEPPGYHAYFDQLRHPLARECKNCDELAIDHQSAFKKKNRKACESFEPKHPPPTAIVPPIKLYVQHFSTEQIEAFNEALRERDERYRG